MNAILALLLLIAYIGIAVALFRFACRGWREFKEGRGRPILALDSSTASRVAAIPRDWPLDPKRWPPPTRRVRIGDPPGWLVRPLVADAYARLAGRRRSTLEWTAQVLFVVAGSWFGVTLPDVWHDYRSLTAQIETHGDVANWSGLFSLGPMLIHFIPAFLIGAAIQLVINAQQYGLAESAYEMAGRRSPALRPMRIRHSRRPGPCRCR